MLRITDISGIEVGHSTHVTEKTGCTAILCKEGAVAGVDIRGSAPGTRETDLLHPMFMIRKIQAIMLTGGSAFGLRTVDGAMQYLAENNIGYDARGIIIPIIPAAVIFDLREGRNPAYPSVEMGYQACQNAGADFEEGFYGAGRGATVGKVLGLEHCMAGGIASAGMELKDGVRVAALVVVNALGDVIDPSNGEIVAGARKSDGSGFADAVQFMLKDEFGSPLPQSNTTLAVVATNAQFDKEEINKIAQMAQSGISRSIRPVHTMHDGDIVFALSNSDKSANINVIGEVAAMMVSEAILRAVRISNKLGEKD